MKKFWDPVFHTKSFSFKNGPNDSGCFQAKFEMFLARNNFSEIPLEYKYGSMSQINFFHILYFKTMTNKKRTQEQQAGNFCHQIFKGKWVARILYTWSFFWWVYWDEWVRSLCAKFWVISTRHLCILRFRRYRTK